MNEFIYENNNALTSEYCDHLIALFESNKELQHEGEIGIDESAIDKESVILKNIKTTIDITIPNNIGKDSVFYDVQKLLTTVLLENLKEYYKKLDPTNEIYHLDFLHTKVGFNGFLMTKYLKQKGFFKLHNDFNIDNNRYRLFNFIWYLNDVDEGGKTIFFDNSNIAPKKGKMAIFPSDWFFSHKGEKPISSDKYIITGWIYNEK